MPSIGPREIIRSAISEAELYKAVPRMRVGRAGTVRVGRTFLSDKICVARTLLSARLLEVAFACSWTSTTEPGAALAVSTTSDRYTQTCPARMRSPPRREIVTIGYEDCSCPMK